MGEARRRQAAERHTAGDAVAVIDRAKLAQAVRAALAPVSELRGISAADCTMYATVGVEALRRVGIPARLQVGEALWRVGPGDADVIHHVAAAGTPTFGPAHMVTEVFHAWIGVDASGAEPAQLVDFTTWQLREKARLLDLADGRDTCVKFCPDYLWVPEKIARSMTASQVAASFSVGVYAYASRRITGLKMPSPDAVAMLVGEVMLHYAELLGNGFDAAPIPPPP